MKRFVPGILVLALAAAVAAAPAHAGPAFGVKGGVSISQVQADLFDTDNRTGFVGGVYGAFDLTPMLGLQPELLYVRKGAKLFSTDVSVGGLDLGDFGTNSTWTISRSRSSCASRCRSPRRWTCGCSPARWRPSRWTRS